MTRSMGVTAGVLLVALFSAAAPAVAAVPVPPDTAVTEHRGDDIYRDWFWSYAGCDNEGRGGIQRGHWDHYTCSEGDVFWHLWTNRLRSRRPG